MSTLACVTHEEFKRYLAEGYAYQGVAAAILTQLGLQVQLPDLRVAPTPEQWADYTDEYDLLVEGRRIDVKSSSRAWTCIDDWPVEFGGWAIVDNVGAFDRKDHKPVAYLLISQPTAAILVVPVSTRPTWRVIQRWNARQSFHQEFYAVRPQQLKTLDEFVEWVQR